ncbi:hypothetical protein EUGRSUZ_E00909 [Eucalyptus grandis]|uniref:Uncharacterized protein n=2 Tax=Eucalyptus grandis TaxID=71139 RepID=A0ACC3KTJ0_EUCGR|nr:hypothetical protein EUGRSUZ_E00909 [Eucalyptus grandis]
MNDDEKYNGAFCISQSPTFLFLSVSLSPIYETDCEIYFNDSFMCAYTLNNGDEIAGCSKKAYDYLSIGDAQQMLLFSCDQELTVYIEEEHLKWQMKSGSVYFQWKWIMTVNARGCEFESVCCIFIVTGEDTLNISMMDFPVAFFSFHFSGRFQL